MKKLTAILHLPLCTLLSTLYTLLTASAAVPLSWTVDMKRAQPATFEAYQGEVIAIEAALHADGKPFEAPLNYSLFWQTNGMGRLYWEAPCTVPPPLSAAGAGTNVLFATWLPSYDVGAKVYNCFIGSPSNNYHTAFQLRLRPSPGALPNVLPLPVPVIDFAKVRVLNPPWESGGGGGVNTNAVIDIIHKTVDGSAKMLQKYLHAIDFDDSYPEAAEMYYKWRSGIPSASCSAVRSGNFLYRNFDFPFDDRAEFIVKMSAGTQLPTTNNQLPTHRFASIGVAQVDTNLTEAIVTSGKPSIWYKALPGATVDGINERGVVAEINVVDGDPQTSGWHTNATIEAIHPLGAIRWILDHATNAQHAATYIAANIRFPVGWTQNFHYMIADAEKTYIVENGTVTDGDEYHEPDEPVTMTNFQLSKFPWDGMGMERFGLLLGGANITNAWYTRAYLRSTNWVSEFKDADEMEAAKSAWETYPRERLRGHGLWQTVHTSVYDISNKTMRIAVQENDDWYTFAVPSSGGTDEAKVREIAETVVAPVASSVSSLQSSKLDKADVIDPADADDTGKAADAKATKDELDALDTAHRAALAVKLDKNSANGTGVIEWDNDNGWLNIDYWPLNIGWNSIIYIGANTLAWNNWQITAPVTVYDTGGFTFNRGNLLKFSDHGGSESTEYETIDERIVRLAPPPAPSPVLRTYDEVRQCWWIGKMVNGVINWEVE